jgi:type II secretory pathway component PulK
MKHMQDRRGTVLIAALVCLAIVMALVAAMLGGTLRTSRQMRAERDRRQCELLLEAGLHRASAGVAASDYQGETWDISAAEIGGMGDGRVTIEVARNAADPPRIRVVAEYPLGDEFSIRRSRTVPLQTTSPLPQE